MLELKPNCECCDCDLPPDSKKANICSYECTFCTQCVATILLNVCPNCGGGFSKRPIRPKVARRKGVSLTHQPASKKRINSPYSPADIQNFSEAFKDIIPENR